MRFAAYYRSQTVYAVAFICLRGRVMENQEKGGGRESGKKKKRDREISSTCWFTPHSPNACNSEGWDSQSKEVSRKLDQKWSGIQTSTLIRNVNAPSSDLTYSATSALHV